jgi:YidC/Oxa1 family membrane protein insertase
LIFLLANPFTELFKQLLIQLNALSAQYLPLPASVSSYAIAIIAVAVLVKLLTYPLTVTQMRSMRSMQVLQPKLTEIQSRYKDDREKLAQAQMELYRENSVNPLGGCLPLVIQMVVLFGLYAAVNQLSHEHVLDGKPFLWIPDLSKCEPSPFCGAETAVLGLPIPILIIIMTVAQLLYQKLLTPPTTNSDPQQAAMASTMKWMPLMFVAIFIKLPAGLVLYYTVFNLVSILQQYYLNRSLQAPLDAGASSGGSSAAVTVLDTSSAVLEEQANDNTSRRRKRKKVN